MKVWIDLANSPHVPLFVPVVRALRERGDDVLLTAREHAQTAELAREAWPDVHVTGGASPAGRAPKARAILARANALRRFARRTRPDVALSHGSYAQLIAARLAGVRSLTMMDYEHQPANHVSFRLARAVLVPAVFPSDALRRFGARASKVVRYDGFKEELYLNGVVPDRSLLEALALDSARVTVAMRPPPEGALYHREANPRFDAVLEHVLREGGQPIVLPRQPGQAARYARDGVTIPSRALDGCALLATVDLTIGAGGTMTRESALLRTPTYTVFVGRLAAVDAELMRLGRIVDLRRQGMLPAVRPKAASTGRVNAGRSQAILDAVLRTVDAVARR